MRLLFSLCLLAACVACTPDSDTSVSNVDMLTERMLADQDMVDAITARYFYQNTERLDRPASGGIAPEDWTRIEQEPHLAKKLFTDAGYSRASEIAAAFNRFHDLKPTLYEAYRELPQQFTETEMNSALLRVEASLGVKTQIPVR